MPGRKKETHYYPVDLPYDPRSEAKLGPSVGLKGTAKLGRGTTVSNPPARFIGDQAVLLAVNSADKRYRQALLTILKNRASEMQAALYAAAEREYRRGTGRFARGIKVKGQTTEQEGRLQGRIHVSLPQYRETRFLTNFANSGYFKAWGAGGIGAYYITAKGVKMGGGQYSDLFGEIADKGSVSKFLFKGEGDWNKHKRFIRNPFTGKAGVSMRTIYRSTPKSDVGRLKVPFEGYGSLGPRGGKGRGRNAERIGPRLGGEAVDLSVEDIDQNELFYYPLWVLHPGFKRDVVSETVRYLANETINQWKTLVVQYQQDVTAPGARDIRILPPVPAVRGQSKEVAEIEASQWVQMSRRTVTRNAYRGENLIANPWRVTDAASWNARFGRRYGFSMPVPKKPITEP